MHNKSFDVSKLNATANYHGLGSIVQSEQVFCSMLESRDICRLPWLKHRSRSTGAFKPPSNGELFKHFFGSVPQGRLHRALADARVTLAAFAQAAKGRRCGQKVHGNELHERTTGRATLTSNTLPWLSISNTLVLYSLAL